MILFNILAVLMASLVSLNCYSNDDALLLKHYQEQVQKLMQDGNYNKALEKLNEAKEIIPSKHKSIESLRKTVVSKKEKFKESERLKKANQKKSEEMRKEKELDERKRAIAKRKRQEQLKAPKTYCDCKTLKRYYSYKREKELSKSVYRKDLVYKYENAIETYSKSMRKLMSDYSISPKCDQTDDLSSILSTSKLARRHDELMRNCNYIKILK